MMKSIIVTLFICLVSVMATPQGLSAAEGSGPKCSGSVSGREGQSSSNVIVIDPSRFGRPSQQDDSQSRKAADDQEAAAKEILGKMNILIELVGYANPIGKDITASRVWSVHSAYMYLNKIVDSSSAMESRLSQSTVERLYKTLDTMNKAFEKSKFFEKAEEAGFSLIPKAGEHILEPLPTEISNFLVTARIAETFIRLSFENFHGTKLTYTSKLHGFMSGIDGPRMLAELVVDPLLEIIPELNRLIEEAVQKINFINTETTSLRRILSSYEAIVNHSDFLLITSLIKKNGSAPAKKSVLLLEQEKIKFLKNIKLVHSDEISHLQLVGSLVRRGKVEDKTILDFADSVRSSAGRPVTAWFDSLRDLLKKLEASNELDLTEEARYQLKRALLLLGHWIESDYLGPTAEIDFRSKDEIDLAKEMKQQIHLLHGVLDRYYSDVRDIDVKIFTVNSELVTGRRGLFSSWIPLLSRFSRKIQIAGHIDISSSVLKKFSIVLMAIEESIIAVPTVKVWYSRKFSASEIDQANQIRDQIQFIRKELQLD